MRILIVDWGPSNHEGGTAQVEYNLARALRALGHEVTVWRQNEVSVSLRPRRLYSIRFPIGAARRIFHMSRSKRPDVVHFHNHTGFFFAGIRKWLRRYDIPVVTTLHGFEARFVYEMNIAYTQGEVNHWRWYNRLWYRCTMYPMTVAAIRWSDCVTVITRESWAYLQIRYRLPYERITYIPNGVEDCFFVERTYRNPIRRLLYVGTWLPQRGINILRESMLRLHHRQIDWELSIVGGGQPAEHILRQFPEPIRTRVHVVEHVPHASMPQVYRAHDIFVLPSWYEGLPIALLEAMATGMPVITTATCGMQDVIQHRDNGWLVTPRQVDELVDALVTLMTSPELCATIGQRAQASVRYLRWSNIAQMYLKVYHTALRIHQGQR